MREAEIGGGGKFNKADNIRRNSLSVSVEMQSCLKDAAKENATTKLKHAGLERQTRWVSRHGASLDSSSTSECQERVLRSRQAGKAGKAGALKHRTTRSGFDTDAAGNHKIRELLPNVQTQNDIFSLRWTFSCCLEAFP
ncbi:predicted protein [Histoplasma mississippiense (nom. inval.)]|uniref:predicted protein n=1 Tax=Ajellomyces capsulatus (strain NAm1 / WU24) TaxID=2059318 RepID=UPI000157BA68|nr:predicted protein [Histoplasma mississippiense (nom. inval.)]EDN05660.1 predicted protein [Histoplasma mississippiense (nom. inval.)]